MSFSLSFLSFDKIFIFLLYSFSNLLLVLISLSLSFKYFFKAEILFSWFLFAASNFFFSIFILVINISLLVHLSSKAFLIFIKSSICFDLFFNSSLKLISLGCDFNNSSLSFNSPFFSSFNKLLSSPIKLLVFSISSLFGIISFIFSKIWLFCPLFFRLFINLLSLNLFFSNSLTLLGSIKSIYFFCLPVLFLSNGSLFSFFLIDGFELIRSLLSLLYFLLGFSIFLSKLNESLLILPDPVTFLLYKILAEFMLSLISSFDAFVCIFIFILGKFLPFIHSL